MPTKPFDLSSIHQHWGLEVSSEEFEQEVVNRTSRTSRLEELWVVVWQGNTVKLGNSLTYRTRDKAANAFCRHMYSIVGGTKHYRTNVLHSSPITVEKYTRALVRKFEEEGRVSYLRMV